MLLLAPARQSSATTTLELGTALPSAYIVAPTGGVNNDIFAGGCLIGGKTFPQKFFHIFSISVLDLNNIKTHFEALNPTKNSPCFF